MKSSGWLKARGWIDHVTDDVSSNHLPVTAAATTTRSRREELKALQEAADAAGVKSSSSTSEWTSAGG